MLRPRLNQAVPATALTAPAARSSGRGVSTRLTAFETDIVDVFVDLAGSLSLPKSYGEIYGLLYASARPLSFTELQETLGLSKGSVSQGLRALRAIGAIRLETGADWRREHFAPETELRQLLRGFLRDSLGARLTRGKVRLEKMAGEHEEVLTGEDEASRLLAGRMGKLRHWHKQASLVLPVIARMLA